MEQVPSTPASHVRRRLVIVAMVLVLGVIATVLVVHATRSGPSATPADVPRQRTVKVVRTTLNDDQTLQGTLGFGVPQQLQGDHGTVTWLPTPGTVVSRNEQLLRIDDRPVALFYGDTPLFRPLDTPNLVGRDVKVVADNLTALGYAIGSQPPVGATVQSAAPPQNAASGPGASAAPTTTSAAPSTSTRVEQGDAVLTSSLMAAIRRWQHATGRAETGALTTNDVMVTPGAVRVASVPGRLNGPANSPLLSVTSTARVVTVQADPTTLDPVQQGEKVQVQLPGGTQVPATVTTVSGGTTTAGADAGNGGDGDATSTGKVNLTVVPDNADAVATVQPGAVQVRFTSQSRADVLAVPVDSLLALAGGGFGLQLAGGALIPVTTGLFAHGMVEVSGQGLDAGAVVVTTP